MTNNALPLRISNISDKEFWASLHRLPGKAGNANLLREAIRLGVQGKNEPALAALGIHQRKSLAKEWQLIQSRARKSPPPPPDQLQALRSGIVAVWHKETVKLGPHIDWFPPNMPSDCRSGMHYLFWLRPAIHAFVANGDSEWEEFLAGILGQYYGARTHSKWLSDIRRLVFCPLGIAAKWQPMLDCYLGFLNIGQTQPDILGGLLKTFLGFGRALDHDLRKFEYGHNGFIVGCATLFHIAVTFPEFKESTRWKNKAVKFLLQHARENFFEDGGNRERCWGYGTMHLKSLVDFYDVAHRTTGLGKHGRMVLGSIRRAYQWYAKTAGPAPAEILPTYGDAGYGDDLGMLSDGKRFFRPAAGRKFGVDRTRSYLLKPSGFAVMRNGDGPESTHINLNFGPFAGWHSHWDLLNINLWSQGERLLEEVCRFGPYANPMDHLFRAPESHNLVLIDGMIYDSRDVKGEDVAWFSNDAIDYFSAYHRAYRYFVFGQGGKPVSPNIEALIRRTVVLVKNPGYAIVMDSVKDINSSGFNRAISQYWHSPSSFKVLGPGRVRTQGTRSCLLAYAELEGLHRLDAGVDFAGAEVADLGHAHESYSLRARRWMPLEHQGVSGFTLLIYPFSGKPPAIDIKVLPAPGAVPWRAVALDIHTPAGRDLIALNPEKINGFSVNRHLVKGCCRVQLGNNRGCVEVGK